MTPEDDRPSEADITRVVHAFYERVRSDEMLAPVFESRIGDEWDPHLARMVAFWNGVLRGKAGFIGDPVGKHRAMVEVEPRHFDRWLELFATVLADHVPPHIAADIHTRASRMRVVLERRDPV
jgi:hemoglobin